MKSKKKWFFLSIFAYIGLTTYGLSQIQDFSIFGEHVAYMPIVFALVAVVLYYLLLVRKGHGPIITSGLLFIGSLFLFNWQLPEESRLSRTVFTALLASVELIVFVAVVMNIKKLIQQYRQVRPQSVDGFEAFEKSLTVIFGKEIPRALTQDIGSMYYTFFGRRLEPNVPEGGQPFTYHEKADYEFFLIGLLGMVFFETIGVHLLLHSMVPIFAWFCTITSVMLIFYFVGDYNSFRLRPFILFEDRLQLRIGLRFGADIPYEKIREVLVVSEGLPRQKGYKNLNFRALDKPNLRLILHDRLRFEGPFGMGLNIQIADVFLDEPERFAERLVEMAPQVMLGVEEFEVAVEKEVPVEEGLDEHQKALLNAVKSGYLSIVTVMLKGSHANFEDENGKTPLMWAKELGHEQIANLLEEHQAS